MENLWKIFCLCIVAHSALCSGERKIKGALRASPVSKGTVLVHHGLRENNDDKVFRGLKNGAPIDLRIDAKNNTLLHYYTKQAIQAYAGLITRFIVCPLLLFGSSPNMKNNKGKTPLHYAGLAGNMELIKLLLEWGARKNVCDKRGRTPYALASKYGADKRVLQLLYFRK
jgi:hypothetical protein